MAKSKRAATITQTSAKVVDKAELTGAGNLADTPTSPVIKDSPEITDAPSADSVGDGAGVIIEGESTVVTESTAGEENIQETEVPAPIANEIPPVQDAADAPQPLVEEAVPQGGYEQAVQTAKQLNAAESHPSGARSDNADDQSMVAALTNYVELMAGNRRTKDDVLIKQQMNLFRVIKTISDSQQNDVRRRWGILMYFINEGSGVNGAFTGNLPFRKLHSLPPQVQPLMEGILAFLVAVGPEVTRGAAIRHLSIPQAASALPKHAQDSFMSYFGQFV